MKVTGLRIFDAEGENLIGRIVYMKSFDVAYYMLKSLYRAVPALDCDLPHCPKYHKASCERYEASCWRLGNLAHFRSCVGNMR